MMKGTQTQRARHLFNANGKRKRGRRAAEGRGGGASLQGAAIDSGRGWDFHVQVLLESDMNLCASTWETHVDELLLQREGGKEIAREYRKTSLVCGLLKEVTQMNLLAETGRLTT